MEAIAEEEQQPASVYHLYRVKRKLLTVSALISERNRSELNREKSYIISDLQSQILNLKRCTFCLQKELAVKERLVQKKRQLLHSKSKNDQKVKRKQLECQRRNLLSHLNNEKLNLRIKNAYLKSIRQQYLHALLSDIFPIICSDAFSPNINGFSKSTHTNRGGGLESMLLSSVMPSALNQEQFLQLDEAINTHYLGQGYWSNDDVSDFDLNSNSQYNYGIVSINLNQPEKYDQFVNLIGRIYSTQQQLEQTSGINAHRQSLLSEKGIDNSFGKRNPLRMQLSNASNLACHLNLEPEVISVAYEQCGALCHLSQLVHITSFVLSVPLPYRQSYSFFMGFDYSPRALHDELCKLDLNIVFLCMSQGVGSNKLRPDHNIRNLIHCFSLANVCLGESRIPFGLDFELFSRVKDFFNRYDTLNRLRFDRNGVLIEEESHDWEELPDQVAMTREELRQIEESYDRALNSSGPVSVVSSQATQILNSSATAILSTVSSWLSDKTFYIND